MAGEIWGAHRTWEGDRDSAGHRSYEIEWLIRAEYEDGPAAVLATPGLPVPGAPWIYGNDYDPWAFCKNDAVVRIHDEKKGDKNRWWTVVQKFSTVPDKRCQDDSIEDPLLAPQKVSGGSESRNREQSYDRYGNPNLSSSHELLRGPAVEFERGIATIVIEQNVALLEAPLCYALLNTVNGATLWGMPARTIFLSEFTFERKYYGSCAVYYTRRFVFKIDAEGWDREVLDEGTKVLNGHWNDAREWVLDDIDGSAPDPTDPTHFIRFKDAHDENARVVLDGGGLPATVGIGTGGVAGEPGQIPVEFYQEGNFLLLGIPITF